MSEVSDNTNEAEAVVLNDHHGPWHDTVEQRNKGAAKPGLQSLPAISPPSSPGVIPSTPAETDGLLSLPWEMLTHIVSHLPAQCVITVLPKVCRALSNVDKDSTAWQLRARRLIGGRARFPVGPREGFDWPTACLEMEQLITSWSNQVHLLARQTQEDEEERYRVRQQRWAGHDGEPAAGQEDGRVAIVEGAGEAAQEGPYGVEEELRVAIEDEDGEMPPMEGVDQLARLREELQERQERQEDDAAAWNHRIVFDANDGNDGALNHQEDLVEPRNLGNGGELEMEKCQPPRSPSPPPALECITLPTGHIAEVNSVLLVGKGGTVCATGSRDYNVKIWDLPAGSNGTLLHTLVGQGDFSTHQGWVWCMASLESLLATGGFDSTVRLWDLQAGGAERGLIRAGAAVLCLSCQSNLLLVGTFDKRVSMYDTRVAEPLVKSLRLHNKAVLCLAADDKYIISGSEDCTVALYDCRANKDLKRIRLRSYLMSMSYSGDEVWAGDNSGMLHSFSLQAGTLTPLSLFDVGHTGLVTGIHKSSGSLYTCSSDHTVKVHIPCAPPRTLCTLHHHAGVYGLSVDAGVLAVSSGNVCVEVWRPRH